MLVIGLSHRSAPVAILERAAVSSDTLVKLLADLAHAEPVAESFVVSTCNRVEVYADVDRFHAGVSAICELLARHWGMPPRELTQYLYVHYRGPRGGPSAGRGLRAGLDGGGRGADRRPGTLGDQAGRRAWRHRPASWATWAGWRCGPASGPGPRPGSGGPASAC